MSDDTLAGITEEIEPATTEVAYAWGSEPDDEFTVPAGHVDQPSTGAPVLAVAALAGVAFAVAAVAAVVVLVTPTRTDHYDLRPMPVQAAPAPPKAAPAPAPPPPVAAPAPVVVPPPVQARVVPSPAAPPPDANQTFTQTLRGDKPQTQNNAGLYPTEGPAAVDAEAKAMCQDLAGGGSLQPYIDGTLTKSPSLAPWQAALAVRQAVGAYCPQYANR